MKWSISMVVGTFIAVYCLSCWLVLEVRNKAVPGGVLQQYHHEYADGGSKAWRFSPFGADPRKPLHDFITTFGLLLYPIAVGGILFFGARLLRKYHPLFSLCVLLVCAVTLARFIMLGVFTAALEL